VIESMSNLQVPSLAQTCLAGITLRTIAFKESIVPVVVPQMSTNLGHRRFPKSVSAGSASMVSKKRNAVEVRVRAVEWEREGEGGGGDGGRESGEEGERMGDTQR
jgi:hypothetical protein